MSVTRRIHSTLRNTRRIAEIATVLVRHGFHGVVAELKLGDGAPRPDTGVPVPAGEVRSTAARLRQVLEELGPVFIKLGQVLSTRPDLIPGEVADEFRKLQEDAPRVPFHEIRKRLDAEFAGRTDEHFASIEPDPVGAASIAQVHRAALHDGTAVVIKVLRPGIESVVRSDMEILGEIARFAEAHFEQRVFSPRDVVEEFSRQIHRELDLTVEARATERLGRQFTGDDDVTFPAVYHEHSTTGVLTMEEIHGTLLSRLDPASLAPAVRRRIVEHGVDAVYHMCLEHRFFHADPHPGNIFVLDGARLCFIDCGMTGRVDERTAGQLARWLQGVVSGDVDEVIRTMLELAAADPALQYDRRFRNDVSNFVGSFEVGDGSLEQLQLGAVLLAFFDLLRRWRIRCPSDVVFLLKALVTIEGAGRTIDPSFDLIGHVRPILERHLLKRYGLKAMRRRLVRTVAAYADIVEDLPNELRSLAAAMHRRDFAVNLRHQNLDRLADTIDRASRTIAYGLVLAAVILSAAILILADRGRDHPGIQTTIGFAVLAGFGLMAVGLAVLNRWRVYRARRPPRR